LELHEKILLKKKTPWGEENWKSLMYGYTISGADPEGAVRATPFPLAVSKLINLI
jgi:hypothetical protein